MDPESPLSGAEHIEYRGPRYVLGRTGEAYAIWDAGAGGEPLTTYPQTYEGWKEAWFAFREMEPGEVERVGGEVAGAAGQDRLGLGGILDGTFRMYGRMFAPFAGLLALVTIPLAALQFVAMRAILPPELQLVFSGALQRTQLREISSLIEDRLPLFVAAVVVFIVVGLLVQAFTTAVLVRGGVRAYVGERPGLGELVRAGRPLTLPMLLVLFLTGLAILAPLLPALAITFGLAGQAEGVAVILGLAVGLGAMLLYARLVLAPSVLVAEGLRGIDALRRSWRLTAGRTWPVFGTVLLIFLLAGLAAFVIMLPFQAVTGAQTTFTAAWIASMLGGTIAGIVTGPFTMLGMVFLYVDARARRDLDIKVLRSQLTQSD